MATRQVKRFASLRFKFALALALFSSILMVSVMLLLEQRLRDTLVQESIDKGFGIARGLAFNAEDPLLNGDDPLRAFQCAMEMQSEGTAFNQQQETQGLPPLPMGIGINTGPVVAGNIGSSTKMEYTVIGDQVNIAARMQGIAQPGEVLISENTYRIIADAVHVTQLEPITFKGKNTMVEVYRVDGLRENK